MSKKGIIQNAVIIVLGLAIICMSVGYAAYDSNKVTNESPTIEKSNWDVHLENPIKTINSTIEQNQVVVAPSVNQAGTEARFEVSLKPNDVYEFTIDVRNSGSFNAQLSSYTLTASKDGAPVVIYDSLTGHEDAEISYEVFGVTENEVLGKGQINTKTVRIKANANNATEAKYEFKFNMTYVQNK